jgi:hypothetical protein
MTSTYNLLREACDISQLEAADYVHETRLDTVKSWSSDRRPAPQWAINQLQSLLRRIRRAGEIYADEMKGMIAAGYSLQIGLPADDADARAHGFPSSAAALRAIAVALSLLPDDAEIRLISRAQSPIVSIPKLEPDKMLPTATDRQVIEDMDFAGPKSQCTTSGNVNRRKYERLENIGWITHFCPNLSDVVYELTEAGSLELALLREARFAARHPAPSKGDGFPTQVMVQQRPRAPVRLKAGENFRFNQRSYRVDRIDGDVVTVHNSDQIEMIISAPAELLG